MTGSNGRLRGLAAALPLERGGRCLLLNKVARRARCAPAAAVHQARSSAKRGKARATRVFRHALPKRGPDSLQAGCLADRIGRSRRRSEYGRSSRHSRDETGGPSARPSDVSGRGRLERIGIARLGVGCRIPCGIAGKGPQNCVRDDVGGQAPGDGEGHERRGGPYAASVLIVARFRPSRLDWYKAASAAWTIVEPSRAMVSLQLAMPNDMLVDPRIRLP